MQIVMEDTKSPMNKSNGHQKDQFIGMHPKIGSSFGMHMDLDGVLEKQNTWYLEVIGTEVSQMSDFIFVL